MASELAQALATRLFVDAFTSRPALRLVLETEDNKLEGAGWCRSAVADQADAELREVHEVLHGLGMHGNPKDKLPCWCKSPNPPRHEKWCNRARALYPKLQTTTVAESIPGQPEIIDRADGVRGHYAIGRKIKPDGFSCWEFWNKDKWCSAGEVFVRREAAEQALKALLKTQ